MVNIISKKAKRITASFLAVCVFAMAVLPYGNISFADTSIPSSSGETSIDITIPANEKLVIGTEKGTITTVNEENSVDTSTEPSNEESSVGTSTGPSNEENSVDTSTGPSNEENSVDTSTEPSSEESSVDTSTEPSSEESSVDTSTEPSNEESSVDTSTEPSNEENSVDTSIEPSNEESSVGTSTEPSNEENSVATPAEVVSEENKMETPIETAGVLLMNNVSLMQNDSSNNIATVSNDPEISDFTAKVLRSGEEINTGYAKLGDTIVLEYTATNCSDALKVIFDGTEYVLTDLTETSEIAYKDLGENKYSISKELKEEDTVGSIEFKFEDGNMQWTADTKIIYDNSFPTFVFNIEYGNLGVGTAVINGTPKDNNNIADVSVYKDEVWNSISGVKSGEAFKYTVNAKGTYKFRVTDIAGNSLEKDVVIENGNEGMVVKKLPNKTTYLKNEEILLEGGYLKITNTFGEAVTTDTNTVLVCFCEDGCDCAGDGICDPNNGCQNSDYVIPMTLATIVSVEEVSTEGVDTIKKITLAYDVYKPTFEIIIKDINEYNITMDPSSGKLFEDDEITINVEIAKATEDAADITEKYYTWSTLPDNTGSEVYTASFIGTIQDESDNAGTAIDGVFTYSNILDDSGNNVDSGLHWEYKDEIYRSGNISYGKDAITSQKRITIDSGDTDGIISFEYMTNSPSGDVLTVSVNGEEVLRRDGKYDWQSFSRKFDANSDDKYVIDLCFARSGVTSGYSNNYVAIRNLTFTGEKQWKELQNDTVKLLGTDVVGKNNYLYIKAVNADGESIIEYSGNFEYQSALRKIFIETVPNNTVYYVQKDETDSNKYLKSTSSIVTGGEITLEYDKGSSKIPMSIADNSGNEVLNSNVTVAARPLKNLGDGALNSTEWYNSIDLRYPGVWDIRVSYSEDGVKTFFDYYTITVNYNETDGKAILNARDVKVNKPEIVSGMVPVKWVEVTREVVELVDEADSQVMSSENVTEGFWITTTEYDTEWYDYAVRYSGGKTDTENSRLWANIMLKDDVAIREVIEPKNSKWTLNNLAGKRIDAYGSMFVWIPRFSYSVDEDYVTYNVEWSDGTTDTLENSSFAFSYEDKELTGFWMGKYEASIDNDVIGVKPYVSSNFWGNKTVDGANVYDGVTVDTAYDYSKNIMLQDADEYGVTGTALSHLVTMAEWDAISILSMSTEGYANSPAKNAFSNGGSSYTGYNSNKEKVVSNSKANSSTTFNMSGVFDMHGGANEIVSVYVGNKTTDKPDIDVLTFTDVDDGDAIATDIEVLNKWLLSKMIRYLYEDFWVMGDNPEPDSGNWENTIMEDDLESDFIMKANAEVIMRGDYNSTTSVPNGIFSMFIGPYSYFASRSDIPVGFRPSILITEETTYEEPKITVANLIVKTYKDGNLVDKNNVYASVGDAVQLTLKLDKDQMNISDVIINGKEPTSSIPELGAESSAQEWLLTYKVEEGDTNGAVQISYKYKIQGKSEWEGGPNDVNTVYVDTTPGDADIGLSNDKKKVEITVIAGNEGDSGVKVIKVEKREEGEEEPGIDFFGDGGEIVDLGDGGKGSVDITGPGIYYVYIEDEAGNTIIKKVIITSGTGEGEFDINDIIPKLENMTLSVLKDGNYVTNVECVKRLDTVKVDMTFDQELTVGPIVYILGEKATVSGDENNKKLWMATCNRVGNQYAYEDIPITISDYEYYGNKGETVIETFDDLNADGTKGVTIPYDGSLVKANISDPTLFNKNGEVWEVVENLVAGKDIALEYVVTFSDPIYTRENIERLGLSNLEASSINISPSNIAVTTDNMTADISVSAFTDSNTGNEVPEKRIVRFENVTGEGRFGFSIAGAKYSDDLSTFTNYVAQDKYGNPNEQFSTSGMGEANTPIIDTHSPELTSVSIYSDNENSKFAKNGDTITVKFAMSEELGTLPTVTIFANEVETNYVNGFYVAEYLIPSDAEYTEGIVPFSVSNYSDVSGNVGSTLTQDDLNSSENVTYDITAPTIVINPNGGEFTDTTVAVTLTDSPAGVKDSILKYYWNTEAAEPEIADSEWSLATISQNNAVISSPTGLNASRYLIIKGISDNSGNVSSAFISNEFIFSNIVPTLEISEPSVDYTKSGDVVYTVTYYDASSVNLTLDKINLIKTGTADLNSETGTITISGEGNGTRTVTISNLVGDGTIGIEILPGSASSSSGVNDRETVRSSTFGVDNTAPAITFAPENSPTALVSLAVNVTVLDPISNNVSSGLATSGIKYAWSNDGVNAPTEWTDFTLVNSVASVDAPSENGDWYLWIKALEDNVGNTAENAVGGLYKIDIAEPLIEVTSIYTDNTINTIANNGNVITIEMLSNKDLVTKPTVTINCGNDVRTVLEENVTGSAKNWVATYTVPTDEATWINETVLGYSISNYVCGSGYTGATVTNANSGIMYKNHYEVIVTTSPDTVIDDTDPDNLITTPGVVTGAGDYNAGASVTITVTPADGYRFDRWTVMGVTGFTDLTATEQTFTMPNGNVMAVANFVKTWTVVFKGYDGEILSTQVVDNGSAAIAPTAPSRSGYSFTGWEPTPSDANFLNVNCDMELVATYSRKTYTITAYAGSNGTISPAGSVSVSYGANKRFNISPNNGYKILDVIVDGVSVGAVNTYLFEDVTSNHTIHVTFTEDVRYELEGEWYYDNIELVADSPEYVFRSRETLDEYEDASATITIENPYSVNVSFEYILNARDDAMFGIAINGKPLRRVIESTDTWTEFNETVEPVDGKIVIGLTYSKGENPTADESFLDLAAIKNLEVE